MMIVYANEYIAPEMKKLSRLWSVRSCCPLYFFSLFGLEAGGYVYLLDWLWLKCFLSIIIQIYIMIVE